MFVNRSRELASLDERYASGRAELYILYGRRRVGKTELLRTFCEGKRHIFFIADLGTEASALADFTRQVSSVIFGRPDAIGAFPTWSSAFEFLAQQTRDRRLVVILDEFTHLAQVNPAVPSIVQKVWDAHLQHTQIMLVLCGSYVGLMERQVLSYSAPLYGRRTAQWHLKPLAFVDSRLFFPRYSPADQVRAYAILGGIPAYLRQFSDQHSIMHNVEHNILTAGTYLLEEPRLLLLQELAEPGRYFAILEAVANKRTRPNEIAQAVGLAPSSLPFYLGTLRELGLLERVVSVTEPHPDRSKRSSYSVSDNFFRFWFNYVYPDRSLLGRGEVASTRQVVERTLDEFTSVAFESICREHIWRLHQEGALSFSPRAVGSWWAHDGTQQIDVVAVGADRAILGECKWTSERTDERVLDTLRQKALHFQQDGNVRSLNLKHVELAVFSRSGFSARLRARASIEGIRLFDLTDIS